MAASPPTVSAGAGLNVAWSPGSLDDRDAAAARARTDVATISILQQRTAETLDVDLDSAFAVLRGCAGTEQRLLSDAAAAIIRRERPVPGVDAVSARCAAR
ncbi:hypothetical protein DEI99_007790 [Curtobacterium sp. MCLR17_036]|uniref:hypothetical protein n=1 Tax=Curtobacterium sp. MCLR17_036 TaxID=2175620 RepID=UPI0015E8D711|nr:hypothetical protein [Curtobacterium sp. MCLR17_036]WIE66427.1 hypothetical protein DEI99_007790 [Curtobacterium sp. MCLR17_036]